MSVYGESAMTVASKPTPNQTSDGPVTVTVATPVEDLVEMSPAMTPLHLSTLPHSGMATHRYFPGDIMSTEHAVHCSFAMQYVSQASSAAVHDTASEPLATKSIKTPAWFSLQYSPLELRAIFADPASMSIFMPSVTPVINLVCATLVVTDGHAAPDAVFNVTTATPEVEVVTVHPAGAVGSLTVLLVNEEALMPSSSAAW
mmetsp:Transcript_6528/g.16734  ORF Transcript_6528/g.16734 Transcript_6528/m.16734 type:complete len:201 (-) Transcript_6528:996-1598(-)